LRLRAAPAPIERDTLAQARQNSGQPAQDGSGPAEKRKPARSAEPRLRFTREETTSRILDAAEELFSHRDPKSVTVREIAAQAGVTHALVHQYVGTKADILNAVIVRDAPNRKRMITDMPDLHSVMPQLFEDVLNRRIHTQSIIRSAMDGVEYASLKERTEVGRALIDLADASRASGIARLPAPDAADPRIALAAAVAMTYGWVALGSWLTHIFDLEGQDPVEVRRQLKDVLNYMTDLVLDPGEELGGEEE
jgi:AcrR family transcriptional regulator